MKLKQWFFAMTLAVLSALPGTSATLSISATGVPDAGLFDYTYHFAITGAGAAVDNIFLGSDDISPLNVVLQVNGTPTSDWSWLGNDSPQNYLQLFAINGVGLGDGDSLDVSFSSQLMPQATHFAVGLDSATGEATDTTNALVAPSATSIPEPGCGLLLGSALVAGFMIRGKNRFTSGRR